MASKAHPDQELSEISHDDAKMLFELHHRQLNETQHQIQSITEKSVGLVLLITGWIALSGSKPSPSSKIIFALGVGTLELAAIVFLFTHAVGWRRIALVVERLNEQFHLFEHGSGNRDQPLYPASWRGFGHRSLWKFIGGHIAAIVAISFVAECAIFYR